MFEAAPPLPTGGVSLLESELSRWLFRLPGRPVFTVDGHPHGRRALPKEAAGNSADAPPIDEAPPDALPVDALPVDGAAPDALPVDALPVDALPVDGAAPDALPVEADCDELPTAVASLRRLLEDGAGHLAAAKVAHLESCRSAAVQARELAAFAAQRPAAVLDRPDGEVGAAATASRARRPAALTAVSEWAVDEVAAVFALSSPAAERLLTESVTLAERLPATLTALQDGVIGPAHARMLTEVLAPLGDAARAEVEARLLARAAGKTVTQLRDAARRAVLRADASAAARRLADALRHRSVRIFPADDGMASLAATMALPVARACHRALQAYAAACAVPGDRRSTEERMADCLTDLILRPGAAGLPPVQAQLTIVASVATLTGGAEPGEIDGHPVPAVLVRELAFTLGLLPSPHAPAEPTDAESTGDRTADARPTDPLPTDALPTDALPTDALPTADGPTEEPAGAKPSGAGPVSTDERAAADLAALLNLRTVAGTALAHLPTLAVTDEITGHLLALTTGAGLRQAATTGDGLDPPPDTDGYTPAAALDRFTRARDRRCRFPGCRTPAQRCDLDHNTPWPAGPTSQTNLCCLCRHHHRLRHQAPGWTIHRHTDGTLEWTLPGGHTITTHPPRYGTDDDLPPPTEPDPATAPPPTAPLTPTERVLGRPLPSGVDADEPPF